MPSLDPDTYRQKWQVILYTCYISNITGVLWEDNNEKNTSIWHTHFSPHAIGHMKSHGQAQSQKVDMMKPWQGREKELGTIFYPEVNGSGRTVVLYFPHLPSHSEKGLRKYVLFGIWANSSGYFQPGESWGLPGHFTFHTVVVLFSQGYKCFCQ